jgi:hypothetical protein
MKKHLKRIMTLALLTVAFVACGKKNDNNSDPVNQPISYYMNNGQCFSNLNQPVAMNYCNAANSYQMSNGVCYQGSVRVDNNLCSSSGYFVGPNGQCVNQNGQPADISFCNNVAGNGNAPRMVCQGQFYDRYNQIGTCNGQNCSGYILRNAQTGQTVFCI